LLALTKVEALAWLRQYSATPVDFRCKCAEGHTECSTEPAGHCLGDIIERVFADEPE